MTRLDTVQRPSPTGGFEGGIAGLGLSDLVQLNAQKRFSGCIRVECEGKVGLIFFRDGEIHHAEVGQKSGEEAFCELLEWPRGRFSAEQNVVAARRTIQGTCEHLLLDAHRILDERRARQRSAPAAQPAAGGTGPVEAVRRVPGVLEAVLLTREGKRVGEGGHEADVLAGQTAYLGMAADELGALFQAGELRTACVQASARHLLLYANKTHFLGVAARPQEDPGGVDSAIRQALAKGR
jgi:hypothetical protein